MTPLREDDSGGGGGGGGKPTPVMLLPQLPDHPVDWRMGLELLALELM